MENLYAKIGQRIVQIRHANNLTQYQLAEMLDISVKHCSAIERGKSSLSLEKMIDLCDIFNIDLDYLIRGVQKTNDIPSYIPHTVVEIMTSDDEEKKQHFRDYIEIFMLFQILNHNNRQSSHPGIYIKKEAVEI